MTLTPNRAAEILRALLADVGHISFTPDEREAVGLALSALDYPKASPLCREAIERAYVGILASDSRAWMQTELITLREAIREFSGRGAQDVQDAYESAAMHVEHSGWTFERAVVDARKVRETL